MQRFAAPADEGSWPQNRLDLVHFVLFGDCRKGDDVPWLLSEHMANEIVLVEPLQDDDNGAGTLVVEPTV
jgi:hypothetical protein